MNSTQVVELLARREGYSPAENWKGTKRSDGGAWVWKKGNLIFTWAELPKYDSSLDALQPVLATLSEEEWLKLEKILKAGYKLYQPRHALQMKPELLATCIAKAIEKKGEEE